MPTSPPPEQSGNRCTAAVSHEICDAGVPAGDEGLMKLVADSIEDTDHDSNSGKRARGMGSPAGGRNKDNAQSENAIEDGMSEFIC